jgi:hypothetical protein
MTEKKPDLQQSWLNMEIRRPHLQSAVDDARGVCDGNEVYIRTLREALEAVFERWRLELEHGTLPANRLPKIARSAGSIKHQGEYPPDHMDKPWADYSDLLKKLREEEYPSLMALEAVAGHSHKAPPVNAMYPPVADQQKGMQQILAALIFSEVAAGNDESAVKAHSELRRIRKMNQLKLYDVLLPIVEFAAPFKKNSSKPRKPSPIRKAIARELAKNPKLWPRQLWEVLAKKHPKGWDFDGEGREGRIWITGREPMGYARFSEVCKEEKDKLTP